MPRTPGRRSNRRFRNRAQASRPDPTELRFWCRPERWPAEAGTGAVRPRIDEKTLATGRPAIRRPKGGRHPPKRSASPNGYPVASDRTGHPSARAAREVDPPQQPADHPGPREVTRAGPGRAAGPPIPTAARVPVRDPPLVPVALELPRVEGVLRVARPGPSPDLRPPRVPRPGPVEADLRAPRDRRAASPGPARTEPPLEPSSTFPPGGLIGLRPGFPLWTRARSIRANFSGRPVTFTSLSGRGGIREAESRFRHDRLRN